MATLEFKLPDIGEGVHEGEIVRWIVAEGASVKQDDPIVEVMTDKATVEIPSPAAGVLRKRMFKEGDIAKVGDVLFALETGAAAAPAKPPASAPAAAAPAPAPAAAPAKPVAAAPAPAKPAAPQHAPAAAPAPAASAPAAAVATATGTQVLAAPATRRLARELGVDLAAVSGSGPHGRIQPQDVRAATAPAGAVSAAPAAPPAKPLPAFPATAGSRDVERVPFRGVRRITAEAMTRSTHTAAHFSLIEEVDVTELVAARGKAKEIAERHGLKLTFMPYIMKATAIALAEFPQLNAELDEQAQEIVVKKYVNLGVAVDTPRGLLVPVIEDVHLKGLLRLAAELADVAARAREGRIKPDELKGSTFSITNAGNIGGVLATPIINFPNVAILGVHKLRRLPRVLDNDQIVPRDIMWLSISIDHRLVDGADGARFMVRVRELLEDPSLMLL